MATRAEIITSVRFKLDEYSAFDSEEVFLMENGDKVKPIEEIIDSQIDEACRELSLLLPAKKVVLDITFIDDKLGGRGLITYPSDFSYLQRLCCESWTRDITNNQGFFSINSPKYKEQCNIATRARQDKPIALIDKGAGTIELFGIIKDTDTQATLSYTQNVVELDNVTDLNIVDCIVLCTSAKVFGIFDNMQAMQLMQAELQGKVKTMI